LRKILPPTFDYETIYRACVDGKHEPARTTLLNIIPTLLQYEINYRTAALNGNLWQLPTFSLADMNNFTKAELNKLYDERFVKNPSPGRHIYDHLAVSGKPRCTLCNHSYPTTLDHYLPKDINAYPELSIVPINLIACCPNCNRLKHTHIPSCWDEQFFHPYFEDANQYQWLSASIIYSQNNEVSLRYEVLNIKQNENVFERFKFQFQRLELAELYGAQAATVLEDIYLNLENLYAAGGQNEVSAYLYEEYNSRFHSNPNSWQTALYCALYQNPRFCSLNWQL